MSAPAPSTDDTPDRPPLAPQQALEIPPPPSSPPPLPRPHHHDGISSALPPISEQRSYKKSLSIEIPQSLEPGLAPEAATPTPSKLSWQATFNKVITGKDAASLAVPDGGVTADTPGWSITIPLVGKLNIKHVKALAREWVKKPENVAFLVWVTIVAISGAILFLVMTGMLNAVLTKPQRDVWFEVNNQILNALFTLMCLIQHPTRLQQANRLRRWNAKDITKMRTLYCKGATRKPNEWFHMVVTVSLLNLNCFSQYALACLNWFYSREDRPIAGIAITFLGAFGSAAAAGVYLVVSPLGKDYDVMQLEAQEAAETGGRYQRVLSQRGMLMSESGRPVSEPQWQGGVFSCLEDHQVCCLSAACCFCVFGHNMERLGLGNALVHTVTFMLFCFSPYLVFALAAGTLENKYVVLGLSLFGVVACWLGTLYGGFWRTQIRQKFNLPGQPGCQKCPVLSDCCAWLCCCCCALAQEVRTAEFYDVQDSRFVRRPGHYNRAPVRQLSRIDTHGLPRSRPAAVETELEDSEKGESVAEVVVLTTAPVHEGAPSRTSAPAGQEKAGT